MAHSVTHCYNEYLTNIRSPLSEYFSATYILNNSLLLRSGYSAGNIQELISNLLLIVAPQMQSVKRQRIEDEPLENIFLHDCTVFELKTLLKKQKIDAHGATKKADLIAKLQTAVNAAKNKKRGERGTLPPASATVSAPANARLSRLPVALLQEVGQLLQLDEVAALAQCAKQFNNCCSLALNGQPSAALCRRQVVSLDLGKRPMDKARAMLRFNAARRIRLFGVLTTPLQRSLTHLLENCTQTLRHLHLMDLVGTDIECVRTLALRCNALEFLALPGNYWRPYQSELDTPMKQLPHLQTLCFQSSGTSGRNLIRSNCQVFVLDAPASCLDEKTLSLLTGLRTLTVRHAKAKFCLEWLAPLKELRELRFISCDHHVCAATPVRLHRLALLLADEPMKDTTTWANVKLPELKQLFLCDRESLHDASHAALTVAELGIRGTQEGKATDILTALSKRFHGCLLFPELATFHYHCFLDSTFDEAKPANIALTAARTTLEIRLETTLAGFYGPISNAPVLFDDD